MSQISPPIRILLVAVIGLVAVYMLFLRPKPEEAVPAAAAPTAATPVPAKDPGAATSSGSGAVVQNAVKRTTDAGAQAKVAAGETAGGLAADDTAATGTAATGTTAADAAAATIQAGVPAPVTKATLISLPKDVRRAVRRHKVLVLLFYNNRSSDDRAVRRALSKVDDYGNQVFVDAHWIKSVSKYQAITRGVEVEQSPTIVVADGNLKADTLVGYVDTETINQSVVDAIRASGGSVIKDPYFRKLDRVCASTEQQVKAIASPTSPAGIAAYLASAQALSAGMVTQVAAIKPPAKHKGFHKHFKAYTADTTAILTAAAADAKAHPATAVATATAKGKRLDKKFIAKNGAHGLRTSCF
jgi:hypothetical protein